MKGVEKTLLAPSGQRYFHGVYVVWYVIDGSLGHPICSPGRIVNSEYISMLMALLSRASTGAITGANNYHEDEQPDLNEVL